MTDLQKLFLEKYPLEKCHNFYFRLLLQKLDKFSTLNSKLHLFITYFVLDRTT